MAEVIFDQKINLLIIEDDVSTAKSIQLGLVSCGVHCDLAYNGHDGMYMARSSKYHIILLDMMLPDIEGNEIIQNLRIQGIRTPIIVLSALSHPEQKIKALRLGADDYMTKPFSKEELIARIHAILKRSVKDNKSIVNIGKITIDFSRHIIKINGNQVKLTDKEYAFIELLILRRHKFTNHNQIISHLYGNHSGTPLRAINVFVCRVRKKFETISGGYNFIQTIWGSGYRLVEDGEIIENRANFFSKKKNKSLPDDENE